jgi:hypothetical protein
LLRTMRYVIFDDSNELSSFHARWVQVTMKHIYNQNTQQGPL